jgi:hypothetical protein
MPFTKGGGTSCGKEAIEVLCSVPIQRTRWTGFWILVATIFISFLLAVAPTASLLLLPANVITDGALTIIIFGFLWFILFFSSFPLQRRYARSLALRQPGLCLFADGTLTIP